MPLIYSVRCPLAEGENFDIEFTICHSRSINGTKYDPKNLLFTKFFTFCSKDVPKYSLSQTFVPLFQFRQLKLHLWGIYKNISHKTFVLLYEETESEIIVPTPR